MPTASKQHVTFNLRLADDKDLTPLLPLVDSITIKVDVSKITNNFTNDQPVQSAKTARAFNRQSPDLHHAVLLFTYTISYPIKVASIMAQSLFWPMWHKDKTVFTDYLWQSTCLECFIAANNTDYVEINASPNGAYALYYFNGYRTPNSVPPNRLKAIITHPDYIHDSQRLATLYWSDTGNEPKVANDLSALIKYKLPDEQSFSFYDKKTANRQVLKAYRKIYLQRQFYINMQTLPWVIKPIKYLHPCVILRFDNKLLYYAPAHANPPDFHNKRYWQAIQ